MRAKDLHEAAGNTPLFTRWDHGPPDIKADIRALIHNLEVDATPHPKTCTCRMCADLKAIADKCK